MPYILFHMETFPHAGLGLGNFSTTRRVRPLGPQEVAGALEQDLNVEPVLVRVLE